MARLPHQSAPFLYGILQLAITTAVANRDRRLSIRALGSPGAGALGRSRGRRLFVLVISALLHRLVAAITRESPK